MEVFALPDLVSTQDLEALLEVKRGRISALRTSEAGFPEPVAESTPKRPLYPRADVLRWLVATDRAPVSALPVFDTPPSGKPLVQRWFRDSTKFVKLPVRNGEMTEAHVTRYTAGEYADPRVLTLVVPVGDPGEPRIQPAHLSADVVAALGYGGENGLRGAIAWVHPEGPVGRISGGPLFGAEVPVDPQAYEFGLRLKLLDAELVSRLIGHLLPYWEKGAVAKSAAALWEPRPLGEDTPRVPATHIPPALATAAALRRQCREVIDQITSGRREAPPVIIDELAQLGNTIWDTILSNQFNWDSGPVSRTIPPGWVRPIEPALHTMTDPNLPLPKQPGQVDLFHALEWLIEQQDLPHGMARTATAFYGYRTSIDVLTVDCTDLPEHLRAAIDRHLTPIPARDNWLHEALAEALGQHTAAHPGGGPAPAGTSEHAALGWQADTDPQSHPARTLPGHRAGDLLAYHVPRTLFDIGTPAVVHLFATTVGDQRRYGGILIDRTGALSPIPLNPDPAKPGHTAAELAALALGIAEPLHLGRLPKLHNEPAELTQLASALASTDHLEINWETLCDIVGPRPDSLEDNELVTRINDLYTWKRN
ncbi:hypothetical protein [Nocardia carnea]|uniref:hypothetical protein n=1 Tax=Nocardia carnea TaxID=37328 RepID=UPI0024566C56|nr:hypothetical protein [Nocardia carnea]